MGTTPRASSRPEVEEEFAGNAAAGVANFRISGFGPVRSETVPRRFSSTPSASAASAVMSRSASPRISRVVR